MVTPEGVARGGEDDADLRRVLDTCVGLPLRGGEYEAAFGT